MCDAKVISHKGAAVISRCAECRCVFLWHQNLVLNFTPEQFIQFRDFIREMAFDNHTFPFPDGQERVVMRTPANDLQLTFTTDEWEDLHAVMEEAVYMQEVYAIMERAG
jgi:hypothetical protein